MGQLGFFDADKRLEALSARGDSLEAIDHLVPWESFRAEIEAVVLTPDELKKSSAGRKPFSKATKCLIKHKLPLAHLKVHSSRTCLRFVRQRALIEKNRKDSKIGAERGDLEGAFIWPGLVRQLRNLSLSENRRQFF